MEESKPKKSHKKFFIFLTSLFIISAITFAMVFAYYQKNNQNEARDNNGSFEDFGFDNKEGDRSGYLDNNTIAQWTVGCESDERVQMTHLPMDLSDVSTIVPLGLTVDGHVTPIDHLYFGPQSYDSPIDAYPVYAMADGYIINITSRESEPGHTFQKPPEYRLIMQHSCQTISYFDLVTQLDESISSQVPDLASRKESGAIRIPITAGQEIGRIGGQTLDTAVYNTELELEGFISPELYKSEFWKIHTDDFFSYFPENLAAQMNAKNLRKAEPRSGKIDWDQPGKLIGNWFEEGTNGYQGFTDETGAYWAGHLHIGYDNVLSDNVWISLGDYQGQAQQFYVKGNKPLPESVDQSSGVVKYELIQLNVVRNLEELAQYRRTEGPVQGTILFQVLPEEKLKVEIFPGKTASQVSGFTESATMYER